MGVAAPEQTNPPAKLGEELPIFCERCGYSLHGLPQVRCDACTVLQFHCPECGHHQAINTLRPAAQRIIGRLRAVWLTLVILFKLNFFGWLLFFFGVLAYETSYRYHYRPQAVQAPGQPARQTMVRSELRPMPVEWQHVVVYGMLVLPFGMVGRMLLLRWRRGAAVGVVLAMLVVTAFVVGIKLRGFDLEPPRLAEIPPEFPGLLAYVAAMTCLGAIVIWPIWVAMVKALVPARTGTMLLEWQRSQSERPVAGMGRE